MVSYFLVCVLVIEMVCSGVNVWTSALHIDGEAERIVEAGSTFLLSCWANESVSWTYPESESAQFSDISNTTPTGYRSILTVESSDYLATGFYTCLGESEEASVYVYVSDDENLLAVNSNDVMLLGHQYQDIVIPCKPTSPDVNVTLMYHDRPVKYSKYDPKIGFTIPNITLLDSGFVSCTASKDGKETDRDFILSVSPHSESAPQPEIHEAALHRVVVGQELTMHCLVRPEVDISFTMDWILPESANLAGRYYVSKIMKHEDPSGVNEWVKSLTISPVYKSDEGNYTCKVWDQNNRTNTDTKYLKIYSHEDSFINITVQAPTIEVDVTIERDARWVVDVNAHPNVELTWYDPLANEIPRTMSMSDKFQIRQRSQTVLEIRNVELQDSGNYTLVASNSGGKKVVTLELIVLDRPTVSFNSTNYFSINVPTPVSCFVDGYPVPVVSWKFRRCTNASECGQFQRISAASYNITKEQVSEYQLESIIVWDMREPGELSCAAENEKGRDERVLPVYVTDVPEGFFMEKTTGSVVEGDNLTLSCAVTSYKYWGNRWWFFASEGSNPLMLNESGSEPSKNYSYWSRIEINNITVAQSGNYSCTATERHSPTVMEDKIAITVLRAEAPQIQQTNLPNDEMEISSWQPITWKCIVTGVPQPSILWYKDNEVLNTDDEFSSYELLDGNQTLSMKSLTVEEEGNYTCRARNRKGELEAFVYLKLKENHKTNTTLIISIVVVAFLLFVVLVSFFCALWKMAKEKKELRLAGLHNFEKGMTEAINPDLTLDQQTDSLPYDQKWEFPSSKLKLGKQLGAGAFGVVLKAEAYGIVEEDVWTTVAVKMVKRHADPAYIRALVSELKILAHLGKHLNVVNLLGACTKNYTKRELLVIVEFCKYGNAHNYLLSHRHKFIDQLDPVTGEIDVTKTSAIENYNRISVDSDPNSALVSYNTEMTCLSSERSAGEENSMNKPQWCANLQGDYKRYDLEELSTSTLICWSFQVARGMEYLASRRVLHGDLAARNVLIAENNIVKICDFGFAKNIYSHPEYQKTGDGPVPVKWMAIESITRRIFSTQSDVWSFGIVLWEFFSLAKTPYPGFENYESILTKLESGYRMEKPTYANQILYDIMLECWDEQPCRRPSFSELVMKLGKLLESNVRKHYIDLNEPFQGTIPEGEDYLSMMSPPDYDPPTSHYVNEPVGKHGGQAPNADGYLCMRSSWNPVTPKGGNPEDSIEMRPMLPQTEKGQDENDDYLVPRKAPANADCAFNPSYIMSSNVSGKKQTNNYGRINKV
ncbi:UNVERIFIED_CONTAM: hypothetical protein PYX00_006049 [Menopon gallinae]|uniref:receptor protein-tyrosine kinase n=1 Tax=Menopon gallinae TaxID=328185 RepID=A0AAW2HUR2_9NEOP